MQSGIYTIHNIKTNHYYVGKTGDFKERFYNHIRSLQRNVHYNEYLQRAWNKYGGESFKFEILIECEEMYLESEEHY